MKKSGCLVAFLLVAVCESLFANLILKITNFCYGVVLKIACYKRGTCIDFQFQKLARLHCCRRHRCEPVPCNEMRPSVAWLFPQPAEQLLSRRETAQ